MFCIIVGVCTITGNWTVNLLNKGKLLVQVGAIKIQLTWGTYEGIWEKKSFV